MEQILAGISGTPMGQVLQRIAALPEVNQDHVLDVRQRLSEGTYDLNDRLGSRPGQGLRGFNDGLIVLYGGTFLLRRMSAWVGEDCMLRLLLVWGV